MDPRATFLDRTRTTTRAATRSRNRREPVNSCPGAGPLWPSVIQTLEGPGHA
jgi:hypothetical protein